MITGVTIPLLAGIGMIVVNENTQLNSRARSIEILYPWTMMYLCFSPITVAASSVVLVTWIGPFWDVLSAIAHSSESA
jgi:hypothetical protein